MLDEKSESILIARKLSICTPTSLSLDDLVQLTSCDYRNHKKKYIPPKPCITSSEAVIMDNNTKEMIKENRFSFLIKNDYHNERSGIIDKYDYKLPNITSLPKKIKNGKPLMIVKFTKSE